MFIRRGPGLLGIAARTAVVAGTAGAVAHRQQQRYAVQQQQQYDAELAQQQAQQAPPQYAQPAPAPGQDDTLAQLEKLAQLKAAGILTDEEFAAAKAKVLGL